MNPHFSIIIPLFNKASYIAKTLQSVFIQTYNNYEVVIINDGSTDNSQEIVQSFHDKRIKLFTTQNHGVSVARNFGIKQSSGDFIVFLDADDFLEKTFLETINNLILLYPNEHVFATALNILLPNKTYKAPYKDISLKENEVGLLNYFKSSLGHSILHCANVAISKKAIEHIGYFDESLKTNEDTDYWIRIGFKYKVVFQRTYLANHQFTNDGLSKTNKKRYKSIDFEKYIAQSNIQPESKAFLNKNIYSSIIKYKLLDNKENSLRLRQFLDNKFTSSKQKIIISLPNVVLKLVVPLYNLFNKEKNYY